MIDRKIIAAEEASQPTDREQSRSHFIPNIYRIVVGTTLLALVGCSGAKVVSVTSTPAAGPAPSEILVRVDTHTTGGPEQERTAQETASALQSDLVKRLARAHIAADPFVVGNQHPDAAVLHVSIVEADPGSMVKRFVIGFGVGSAELQATAELEIPSSSGGSSATTFSTTSSSGIKPGLILPGGIALVTGDVIHLVIGAGIDTAMNIHGSLARPVSGTATAIVKQLKKYYATAGWPWPDEG